MFEIEEKSIKELRKEIILFTLVVLMVIAGNLYIGVTNDLIKRI